MATHRTSANFNRVNVQEIVISDGTNSARLIVDTGNLAIQYTKTTLGFAGVENTDWAETGFLQDISD